MTAATARDQVALERRILHERYLTAVTRGRVMQDPDGSLTVTTDNSKDFYQWEAIVRRIACAMKGDHIHTDDLEEVDNIASVMWAELEDRVVAWIEESQRAYREAHAAKVTVPA
jgi:hypothetical protein